MKENRLFRKLVNLLKNIPGVGETTATRFVYFFLRSPESYVRNLSQTLRDLRESLKLCRECNNISEEEICFICSDPSRNEDVLCVVEDVESLYSIEKTGAFKGRYYVIHGSISPIDGVGPEELRMEGLFERIKKGRFKEVIIATNSNLEGETTALFIAEKLRKMNLKITRLAHGIPVGAEIPYIDPVTLEKAIKNRTDM